MDTSQFLEAYMQEAEEYLQGMNAGLLKLEKDPKDKDAIYQIFRAAHTLKSMSATMKFDKIAELAHKLEDLFDLIRNRKLKVSPGIISLGFSCFDHLGQSLKNVSEGKPEPEIAELVDVLRLAEAGKPFKAEKPEARDIGVEGIHAIKVPVKRLDDLMDLAGELISTKIHLKNIQAVAKVPAFDAPLAQLDRLTDDIRREVMSARMIPLEQVFNKFPRMVRDLAKSMGKEVELKLEGADVEMDRTVLDSIDTPLVHLLRNAVDHGIETVAERKALGKPATATLRLSASKERESVTIAVIDDGQGIDWTKIRQKAVQKNIISPEQAKTIDSDALKAVLFNTGFSTSEKVTETSGRGVGLNVVKVAVESLGGVLRMESVLGKGTKVSMKIPASVAIVRLLLVGVGRETYGIPLSNVERVLEVPARDIKTVEGQETLIYRKEDVPLFRLAGVFGIPVEKGAKGTLIVLVETGITKAGLIVSGIVGDQDSIVKPIKGFIRRAQYFSGATILPDGKVVLVTDVPAVLKG